MEISKHGAKPLKYVAIPSYHRFSTFFVVAWCHMRFQLWSLSFLLSLRGADGSVRPVPCVLHMARYWRAWEMRWPFRELVNGGQPWDFLSFGSNYFAKFFRCGKGDKKRKKSKFKCIVLVNNVNTGSSARPGQRMFLIFYACCLPFFFEHVYTNFI